ncbi:MAG: hypothetical protein FWF03_06535, partial [Defluviitaleaceae bacterium]|nr:hypothetical protein [Defluviitaleaceae bacterium]
MNELHGGAAELRPIGEIARYIKKLIAADIPERFSLKPTFLEIAGEDKICAGVAAFKDFLRQFCDRLETDGNLYAKPPKNPKSAADYPFLNYVINLLIEIGYYGSLSEDGEALSVSRIPSFSPSADKNGKIRKPKVPASGQLDCLRFLTLCGMAFKNADFESKVLSINETNPLIVGYPSDPLMPVGLRAMAAAEIKLKERRYWNDHSFLRCDYRLLLAGDFDPADSLADLLYTLPEPVRDFAMNLHRRYVGKGMTCVAVNDDKYHFAYSFVKKSKRTLTARDIYALRVWEFACSLREGFRLVIRAKKIG